MLFTCLITQQMHIYKYVQTYIILHQGVSVNLVAHNKITIIIKRLYKNV
jgi:hypothetical protein